MSRPIVTSVRVIRTIVCALFLAASASLASGLTQVPTTGVTFAPPAGFTALSPDEMAARFTSRDAPRYAIGNERRSTTIAYDTYDLALTDALLEMHLAELARSSARSVPGFEPIDQGMRTINQRRWAYMEFRSTTAGTAVRNIFLMSANGDRLLALSVKSTESDFATLEPALRASIASLSTEPDNGH